MAYINQFFLYCKSFKFFEGTQTWICLEKTGKFDGKPDRINCIEGWINSVDEDVSYVSQKFINTFLMSFKFV